MAVPYQSNLFSRQSLMLLMTPLLLVSHGVGAQIIEFDQTIDGTTPTTNYTVGNGATLTVTGASTQDITVAAGSAVVISGSTVSTLGTGATTAIDLRNANASISGTTLSGSSIGLVLGRVSTSTTGSTATVTGSVITGGSTAVDAGSSGNLTLLNSTLNGGTRGLRMANALVSAQGSSIHGDVNGVFINPGNDLTQANTLNLDGTAVTSGTGAAIITTDFGLPSAASTFNVNNGSTLVGGNGNMLEVATGATATMNVSNSALAGNVSATGNSTVTLNLKQSQMTGDLIAEAGSMAAVTLNDNSTLTGRLENTASVAINSGSQWSMIQNGTVSDLALNGGSVKLGGAASFFTLSVGNLSGSGTFLMDVDFGRAQSDFLDVTGTASGIHSLLIGSTGSDPTVDTSLHVVHAAAGDASFSLAGGAVDLGTYSYDLVKQGANDWYLDAATKTVSPAARSVLALFNTAPTVWNAELTSLRSRMGELRLNGGQSGGWIRTYGNKFNVADASGVGYQQVQRGLSLGADGKLPLGDGQWLAGVMAGQSRSDLDLDRGTSGKVDSYYVGAYTTWLDNQTGYYFDGVLKLNRFENRADVSLSDGTQTKGDYSNSGVGTSLEFGRHIALDNSYFVEPYAQLSGVVIKGKDYTLNNDMRANGDSARSVLGKVGATVGRSFDLGPGRTVQPYLRAAVAHEFIKTNDVQINDNTFNNDLSGSRGELGAGLALALGEKIQLHTDFDYSNGENIEQPWGINLGARYSW